MSKLSKGRNVKLEPTKASYDSFIEDTGKWEPSEDKLRRRWDKGRARAANRSREDSDDDVYFNPRFGYKPEYSSDMRPRQSAPKYIHDDDLQQIAYEPTYQHSLEAGYNSNQYGYEPTQSGRQDSFGSRIDASPYNLGNRNVAQPHSGSEARPGNQFGQGIFPNSNQLEYAPTQGAAQSDFYSLGTQQSASVVGYKKKRFSFEQISDVSRHSAACNKDANLDELQDQDAFELFGLQATRIHQQTGFTTAPVRQQFNPTPMHGRPQLPFSR